MTFGREQNVEKSIFCFTPVNSIKNLDHLAKVYACVIQFFISVWLRYNLKSVFNLVPGTCAYIGKISFIKLALCKPLSSTDVIGP